MELLLHFAHAFGQTYTLPIPLWLFLFGAAASIVVSFVIISWFVDAKPRKAVSYSVAAPIGWLMPLAKVLGVAGFWLMIFSGLLSVGSFSLIIISFWIILLIGLTYVVALFGDVWQYINPFRTMFEGLERVLSPQKKPLLRYPMRWSYYPALVCYVGLIWLELLSGGLGIIPDALAYILLAYGAVTIVAAWAFGKDIWFRYGEFFSVFYAVVARVSSVVIEHGNVYLRRPFAGISSGEAVRFSVLLIVLFMLASTGYDTLRETRLFRSIAEAVLGSVLQVNGIYELTCLGVLTTGLLALYLGSVAVMRRITPTKYSTFELAKRFALTLLPIAVGYHMAHYFPLLFTNGPLVLNYLGDPFQFGWNIAGLADADFSPGPFDAAKVWYAQVGLIVGGHIAALYASHRTAAQLFRGRRVVVRSQYAMTVLMVVYTVASLWILTLALAG